jgi:hypothetical protein
MVEGNVNRNKETISQVEKSNVCDIGIQENLKFSRGRKINLMKLLQNDNRTKVVINVQEKKGKLSVTIFTHDVNTVSDNHHIIMLY